MKIAIIGHNPLALEAFLRFHHHGAAVTWFRSKNEDFSLFNSMSLPKDSFTSELGKETLVANGLYYACDNFDWEFWQKNYQAPLLKILGPLQEIKSNECISITKRFLAPGEIIPERSRFYDLFRVIYKIDPKNLIEEHRKNQSSTFENMSEEFLNSLSSSLEMYQDFDLVLDLRCDFGRASLSVSGRAVGELRHSEKILWGGDALGEVKNRQDLGQINELALVGSDSLAAETLLALRSWLKEGQKRLFIVSVEEDPFESFLHQANPKTAEELKSLLSEMDNEFMLEVESFENQLMQWRELDDFVQVKVPKPTPPIPKVNFFSGHNVMAVDELIDQKRIFLTLEVPPFRASKKHPQNNTRELKTLSVDVVLNGHGKKDVSFIQLDENEIGYFEITPIRPNLKDPWGVDLKKLKGIEDEIFKLFSPVSPSL